MMKDLSLVKLAQLVLFIFICGTMTGAVSRSSFGILRANQEAMTRVPTTGTLLSTYEYSGEGLKGIWTAMCDLETGAFVESFQAGLSAGASGFDGHQPWMRDLSGTYTTQNGGDRPALAVNEAYRNANRWWRPHQDGAEIVFEGREKISAELADHVVVRPRGGKEFDAWFDINTHYLVRVAEMRGFLRYQITYSDYRPRDSFPIAHTIDIDDGTGSITTLTLRNVALEPASNPKRYSHTESVPADAEIVGSVAATTLPFRPINNHIFVDGMVNGQGPYTFLVDTGGHTILSTEVAKQLGLGSEGAATATGAGDDISRSGYAEVRELAFGGLKFHNQVAIVIPLSYDTSIEGIRTDGVVGFELLRRFSVRIDYQAKQITFSDSKHFDPRGSGLAIPLEFYDSNPEVEGSVAGHTARLVIDTGARHEVALTTPFVNSSHFRDLYPGAVRVLAGWGIGGKIVSPVVRVPNVKLGAVTVQGPVVTLTEAKGGVFSDPAYDGNIGSGLLKRFVVTLDYAHHRLYMKLVVPPPSDAGTYDRSGIWINSSSAGYVVAYVAEGSPAQLAGLKVGDIITSVGGAAARPERLSDAREVLRGSPPGDRIELTLNRSGSLTSVSLLLHDLF
jgi:predicted aspartyl protease